MIETRYYVAKFETYATPINMRSIKIKTELQDVIVDIKKNSFTVAELTHAYLNRPDRLHSSFKAARQFVYRNILRMIDAGLMARLPSDGTWPKYQTTKLFHDKEVKQLSVNLTRSNKQNTPLIKSDVPKKTLIERLVKHRADMLCALGEAEEYESLCKELPEICNEAQTLYNEARERSTLLLGKIKALECLLSNQAR